MDIPPSDMAQLIVMGLLMIAYLFNVPGLGIEWMCKPHGRKGRRNG